MKIAKIAVTFLFATWCPSHTSADLIVKGNSVVTRLIDKHFVASGAAVRFDRLGNQSERFQVTYKGIDVFGMHQITHKRLIDGKVRVTEDIQMVSGLVEAANLEIVPTLSVDKAIAIALAGAQEGTRETVTVVGQVELNIYLKGKAAHLVYKIVCDETSAIPASMPMWFIDAHTGGVLDRLETISSYALSDNDKVTRDHDNNGAIGDSSSQILLHIHEYTQVVLDFLSDVCDMDSYDDAGAQIVSYGNRPDYVNAYYSPANGYFVYGNGDGQIADHLGVLDIVAHEIGHAITKHSSALVYRNQPGAINEGASDIMSAMVEYYQDGSVTTDTWNIGEDSWLSREALRYMHRPSDDGYSRDHFENRYTGSGDNGGVHYNSGILNHWFYLLSQGGRHHDSDYRSGTIVDGIGIDAAFDIWFQTWTVELLPSSDFAAAARATLEVCEDLGYDRDTTCMSVHDAWVEVGVPFYNCFSNRDCKSDDLPKCVSAICGQFGECEYDTSTCLGAGVFEFKLLTDGYASETSWELTDDCNGDAVLLSGDEYTENSQVYKLVDILGWSQYTLTIMDSFGDGICCNYGEGKYKAFYEGTKIASGGDFGSVATHSFGSGHCWTTIFYENFESGWDVFQRQNLNVAISNDNKYEDSKSLLLQGDTGAATTKDNYDISGYSHIRVHFFYKANDLERGEGFFLEYKADGGNWVSAKHWEKNTDFSNGQWTSGAGEIDASSINDIKLRFRFDSNAGFEMPGGDEVFIDNVTFQGR